MQLYTKYLNNEPGEPEFGRTFRQTVDCECHHCRRITRMAVPSAFANWEVIAKGYKASLDRVNNGMGDIMQDMKVMYGDDNPAAKYFANQIQILLLMAQKHFTEGE